MRIDGDGELLCGAIVRRAMVAPRECGVSQVTRARAQGYTTL